tara:strand:- start:825 stop:1190 length:366 start_codon:yes stop_codon:yes gene_type:complete
MKYLIANEQGVLTDLGAADETVMFGQNHVLGMESLTDTTTHLFAQSSLDVDSVITMILVHADKSAAVTYKTERTLIDETVSAINSDGKAGFTVLFDALNGVKLPSQVLAQGSAVTGGVTEA